MKRSPGVPGWEAPLVGRGSALRRLTAALERVAEGDGGAVFICGDAGTGKTRLAAEALARARVSGFEVLEGAGHLLEDGLAYAPLLDAFGRFLRTRSTAERGRVTDGLPDLGRLFSDLEFSVSPPLGDPALERTRLFDAVARLLARVAERAPVVLFLDDLHWADETSLGLIHFLARGLVGQRVLLLATYRPDDEGAARVLGLLGSLRRAGLCEEIELGPLDSEDVANLVAGLLETSPPPDLLSLLEVSAVGVPLFVLSLVRALIDEGGLVRTGGSWMLVRDHAPLPPDLRSVILARLDRLSAYERELVGLIAAAGGAVVSPVLVDACGVEEPTLFAALGRLIAQGLVIESEVEGVGAYRLAHPLLQEVVYCELPGIARRRMHRAFARALERESPDALDQLARHYQAAGAEVDRQRTLELLVAAGARASAMCANEEARRHLEAAIELVRAGLDGSLLPSLLDQLAEACERIGDRPGAIDAWTEALTLYQRMGDLDVVIRIRSQLALAYWRSNDAGRARRELDAGLRALTGRSVSPADAELQFTRAYICGHLGDAAETASAAAALAELGVASESPTVRAQAHLAAVFAGRLEGRSYHWAQAEASRALEVAESAGQSLLALRAIDTLANMAASVGEHKLCRAYAERGLKFAANLGAPTLALLPQWQLALAGLAGNDWDEVLSCCGAAVAQARRLDDAHALALLLALKTATFALRGELEASRNALAEARSISGLAAQEDTTVLVLIAWAAGLLAFERGDPNAAVGCMQIFAHQPAAIVSGLGLLGEAQIAAGDLEGALTTTRALSSLEGRFAEAHASRVLALADAQVGFRARALVGLAHAADSFAATEVVYEEARARLEWAGLAAEEWPGQAVEAAQACMAVFERLRMRRYEGRSRKLLRQLGVRAASRRSRRQGLLTARELEVARLVAEGLANAEIARRLVVSERTVTTHLSHIYDRLDIHSRAGLARFARESGLLAVGEDT